MTQTWRPTAAIETLISRADLLERTRRFLRARNLVEVQTSVLDRYGVTDVNIENVETVGYGCLQSSPEFQMKRLLAAGMPSCFQISPAFRAGEVGRWHNTEFTMLEWYELNVTLNGLMSTVASLVDEILGPEEVVTIPIDKLLRDYIGVDVHRIDECRLHEIAKSKGLIGAHDAFEAIDYLINQAVSELGRGRVFLTEYPDYQAALARMAMRGGQEVALRFELVVDGVEIANGYDELADAGEFARRGREDNARRKRLGLVEKTIDPQLKAALTHGLPACCGVAIGLDRLFALALGKSQLRDVQAFGATRE